MAVTNGWGQGVINNTNGWGKLATNNIGAGSVYENSASGDTALIGTSAAFSYSASSFTQADADPTPTITGTTGGTFSGTSGLVFVSTSTGQIDLSASTIAAHVVTYTVGGVSSNFNLSVTAAPFASTQSFSFDGVDDFIGVSSLDTSVLPTGSFSISTWINTSGGGFGGLVQVGDFAGNVAFNLVKGSNRNIIAQIELSGGQKLFNTPNFQFNANEWNNLIFVFDNSTTSQSFKIYVNNVLKVTNNESPSGQTIVYPANSELRLGQWNNIGTTNNYFFEGNIDETAIFNTALSSSDVATIYGTGVPNNLNDLSTPPTVWYRCGENANYKSPQWLMPENSNKDKFSNYSYEFDGVDDRLVGADANLSSAFTQASWSTWFKISQTPSGTVRFYGRRGQNDGHGEQWGIESSLKLSGKIGTGSGQSASYVGDTVLSTGVWYNVVHTFDGSGSSNDDKLKVYLNGSLETVTFTGTVQANLLQSMGVGRKYAIGSKLDTSNMAFNGFIDEVAVWYGTTLTSANAGTIYNSGEPADLTPLNPNFMYIRMGENATFSTNWTVPDTINSPTNDFTSSNMSIEDRVGNAPNSSSNAVSFNMVEADRETDVPT